VKISEVRELSAVELERKYSELKKDLFNLRMQHATRKLENPIRIPETKRDIARVLTVIQENKYNSGKEAASK
jgi:large subunit ribosomal protein L29